MLRAPAIAFAAAISAICIGAPAAAAEDRFALVIGNSKYQAITPLANPTRDAQAFSDFLRAAGFEVKTAVDLDQAGMRRVVGDFAHSLAQKPADSIALIYYAGHGVQVDGENYLIPVDARIDREADVALQAVRFGDIMNALERARGKTRMVFLDSCRNNPFGDAKSPRGLAIVDAPAGTLVAYSTSPGAEAEDGTGSNSPFTSALIATGRTPGLPIESALKNVRLAVHKQTVGRQVPWEISSLVQPFSFIPASAPVASAPSQSKTTAAPGRDKPPAAPDEEKVAKAATGVGRDAGQSQSATAPGQGASGSAPAGDAPGSVPGDGKTALAKAEDKSGEEWREELKTKTPEQALEIAVREDRVVVYKVVVELFPRAPFVVRLRSLLDRRIQMWDWYDAVSFDMVDGYQAFLNLYPDSDLAESARRLLERAKMRSLLSSTSPGALGLASAIGPAAAAPQTIVKTVPVIKEVVKEVPVIKTVVKEVPVVKEVIKTVRVPEVKTVTRVVREPCRCSRPESPRGPNIQITPNFGGGFGIGGGQRGPRGGGSRGGHYR
jgi:hypothetical protein